jgi:hypothetical protein
MQPKRRDHY